MKDKLFATHEELLELAEWAKRRRDDILSDVYDEAENKVSGNVRRGIMPVDVDTALQWAKNHPLWQLVNRLIGPGTAESDLRVQLEFWHDNKGKRTGHLIQNKK